MAQYQHLTGIIQESQIGQRLDQALVELFRGYSRTQIQSWIVDGLVRVNSLITTTPKKKCLVMNILKFK